LVRQLEANGGAVNAIVRGGGGYIQRIDETVATARERFDESRGIGGIGQSGAQLGNGDVYGVVEVAEGLLRPNAALEFFARNDGAGIVEESRQDFQRLNLQPDSCTRFAEFAGAAVQFEDPESG
jgi:hypothetical protein